MGLVTIGAFARTCRLSPKALRLYDELGLLTPAKTDPFTGYRWYAPEQLDQARLVAWLRRIGMPLARIATVCHLPAHQAATEVTAYWAQVETQTAARRELVSILVDHLTRGENHMDGTRGSLRLRWASRCDRGLVREHNQDTVWAQEGLLGVADGFGPATPQAMPSTTALTTLASFRCSDTPGALLQALHTALETTANTVRDLTCSDTNLQGAGTTLTALAWAGAELALVHVGDSRAYLLREGQLLQLTHDDTLVQNLIDQGKLTRDEAESHPQKMILIRALPTRTTTDLPDIRSQHAHIGDRYLLCSDGLHRPVSPSEIHRVLAHHTEPQAAVTELADLVHEAGAPDNLALVVADLVAA